MKRTPKLKVGGHIHVWWSTGCKNAEDENIATILAILPYTGCYPQFCDCVLKLNSETPRGWTEMAYRAGDYVRDYRRKP
jgi:hypothetical protein